MIKNLRKTRQRLVFNANGLVFTAVALQSTLEVDTANKTILKFDMSKWSNFDQNQDGNAILHHLNEIQTIEIGDEQYVKRFVRNRDTLSEDLEVEIQLPGNQVYKHRANYNVKGFQLSLLIA